MPENELQNGKIPMGCTPHLLFTLGFEEMDKNGIPLGPILIVNHPDLYILVRDLLMEQQTLDISKNAYQQCLDAILKERPTGRAIFDIEAFYNGPVKIPPHEESREPPTKEKDNTKV